jgi:flavin-dependent dehydrogenase
MDVLVIGGGPAGLAAAIAARRKGFDVMVADGSAPPQDKPCGEGLMPEALAALRDLGVDVALSNGFPFRGVRFLENGLEVSADFPDGAGLGVRRPVLHQLLVRHAENAGVKLLWNSPVTRMTELGVQVGHEFVTSRWTVGADGSGSRVRRWTGLDSGSRRTGRYATRRHYRVRPWSDYMESFWGEGVQAYVTPICDDEVCIVVMAETMDGARFANALKNWPELNDRVANAELASRERGAITVMHSLPRVFRDRVALVGDASGGVDALTGEGLRMAFRQSNALADAMANDNLEEYQRSHRQIAVRPMRMARALLWMGRHARLRRRFLRSVSAKPALFSRLLDVHVNGATARNLFSISARVGWQFLAL